MASANVKVLVVAGGGGGASGFLNSRAAGGGGGGGVTYDPIHAVSNGSYTVTVGSGGLGGIYGSQNPTSGSNSVFDTITAIGGGLGAGLGSSLNFSAASGGSGGGGDSLGSSYNSGNSGTIGQGYMGGNGGTNYTGGGGGGAAGAGAIGYSSSTGGAGGAGIANIITGSIVSYGGGGGGGSSSVAGAGGSGGGGNGGTNSANSTAGTANTGGGGGGGGDASTSARNGSNGGSGVVIIAFPTDGSTGIDVSSSGGSITTVNNWNGTGQQYQIHTFTSSGTWTCVLTGAAPTAIQGVVETLVVAGGGGGGTMQFQTGGYASGGGGGGVMYDPRHFVSATTYSVTVGAAGNGQLVVPIGGNGGNSVFDTITAIGGGGGAGMDSGGHNQNGQAGGCGGGGFGGANNPGDIGTQGGGGSQGGSGGFGSKDSSYFQGAGGGGAGQTGHNAAGNDNANGGNGIASYISGSSVTYAGGGGGSGGGAGGSGGGAGYTSGVPNNATGYGSGGSGSSYQNVVNGQFSGNGSAGIVIIRFHSDGSDGILPSKTTATGGYTVTTSGGYTIYTFTSNGTFTPGLTWTFTYTAGANGSISGSSPQSVAPGANGTTVTAIPNTGYHFDHWSDNSSTNPVRTDTNAVADITTTAVFAINYYSVTYTAGTGGSITGSTSQSIPYLSYATPVTAVPGAGYRFVSWSDSNPEFTRTDGPVTTNISLTAIFELASFTFIDLAASVITSGYKWLTQNLFNTQQKQTVRPYFTAQVIDDTIQPKSQLLSGSGTPLGQGTMATAPDGTAFAVGLDGSNALRVYRAPNLDSVGGIWPNSTVLNTTGDNFLDSRNVYSINISDYYNGKYRICVWYFTNLSPMDGTNIKVQLQYSDDGGLTFTKPSAFTPSSMPNNVSVSTLTGAGNLSIAAMKPVFVSGQMKMGAFYTKQYGVTFASTFVGYDVYYIYGDTSNGYYSDVPWNQMVNSHDWTLHSLSSYYMNGKHYCVFSGFRNIIDIPGKNLNYSLWTTSVINMIGGLDLWSSPVAIMPIASASSTNLNQFILPYSTVVNGMVYAVAKSILVDSISQTSKGYSAQVATTHTNYILLNSDDGEGFSYPSVFIGTDNSEFNSSGVASFIFQNGFWFLGGALGWLWEYVQNNVVADVSQDIIGYTIQDTAGQASSINLQIANANNKWVGSSPTGQGASAISKNKKICLWQGYYNPDGTTELAPRGTFYIDDINQTVTGTQNDITLVGRDFYKKLQTTVTKFSYQYNGPTFFSDIFDGTFISNWNQISGVWYFVGNIIPPYIRLASGAPGVITLSNSNLNSYGHAMKLFFQNPGSGFVYIYAFYIDSNNYLRLELNCTDGQSWSVVRSINGANTTIDSGTMPFTTASPYLYGVYIRRYDYYKFNFMIDGNANVSGNTIYDYDPITSNSYLFANSTNGEFDESAAFQANSYLQSPYTVGFGASVSPTIFRFFSTANLNEQNNLGVLIRKIARIAGIFYFKMIYTWRELMFTNNFTGIFTITNRILNITGGNSAISNINQMSNGEVSFQMKLTNTNSSNPFGIKFSFRNDNSGNTYYFHIIQTSAGNTFCRFERLYGAAVYVFYNTPYDVYHGKSELGSLNLDLTQWNTVKVTMINGWFHAFINGIMVAAWEDSNITADTLTTGSWGFVSDANTTAQVQNILAPIFWKPIITFGLNSGDDMLSSLTSLITSLRAWVFSDMLSRFKAIFLNSSDASTYTYNTQLYQQNTDSSDKEYVAQVTVYGNGVVATSRNTKLMAGVITRDEVIVDYTITTQQDAQTRADNEIINTNQYQSQYTPKQVINVGAELFDAVTIVNIGNNTSGVEGVTRIYAETFTEGGGSNNSDYSWEGDSGNL